MNPWLILGFVIALGVATAGGYGAGAHVTGLEKDGEFQEERDDWTEQQRKIEVAHQDAVDQAESDRDTLQRYVSNTLGPEYARLAAANSKHQTDLRERSARNAKLELPADDHACDLPAGLFHDWQDANDGPGTGEGQESRAGVGLDAALRPAAAADRPVPHGALEQPSPGDGAVSRLRETP